ncbi:hypothetical protein [Glycomyces buryatensis]|uniref:Nuclear transport factor 2 family protein n=1 Tax=Glycomyces buryatensis TaxID=2570927 RepID=A0A4S8QH75_9ACTN|nr:hypothetical protein [Glycomyces buryatensis]THV43081.1 hypothetical protein FAB82_02265 [Glycomyces buryatensis]
MACAKRIESAGDYRDVRTAARYSEYFLHILTGRKSVEGARQLATRPGWVAFATVRRRLPARFHNVSIRKAICPRPDTAEIIARLDNGRIARTLTLTFQATPRGWRLDHCDLLQPASRPRRRI